MKSLGGFTLFLVLTAFFTVSCSDGESPVESVLVIAPDEGSEVKLLPKRLNARKWESSLLTTFI